MNHSHRPCDLHLHSYYSDGSLSPEALVSLAGESGLSAVSITDHDTIAGQKEALAAGISAGVEVITGIEFSIVEAGLDIHILGYLFDPDSQVIADISVELGNGRIERASKIVAKLRDMEVEITMDEVLSMAGPGTVGRLHIARILLGKEYVSNIQEAFGVYLGNNRPAFVPRKVLKLDRAVSIIREAGGVAVWAHPGSYIRKKGLLHKIVRAGIGGLEAFHPNHTPDITATVLSEANRRSLVCTGGSDYHFPEAARTAIGGIPVSYDTVAGLKKKASDI